VEAPVQLAPAYEIIHDLDLAADRGGAVEILLGQKRDRQPEHETFGEQAHFVDFVDLIRRQLGDDGALMGLEVDEPFRLQPAQRLPHRHAADAERRRQLVLPQRLAIEEHPRQDRRAQRIRHEGGGRAETRPGRRNRDGQARHNTTASVRRSHSSKTHIVHLSN